MLGPSPCSQVLQRTDAGSENWDLWKDQTHSKLAVSEFRQHPKRGMACVAEQNPISVADTMNGVRGLHQQVDGYCH